MATCDARALLCPAFIVGSDTHLIAICERDDGHLPDGDRKHQGHVADIPTDGDGATDPETGFTEVTWWEFDRRTYRGDLQLCTRDTDDGRRCVLPADHAGRCAT